MAKVTKRVVVYRASTKGRTAEAKKIMDEFRAEKRIRKGRLLPSPTMTIEERIVMPKVSKRRKPTAKKKTTAKKSTTTTKSKSIISPICRKAGRQLKATGSPSAGRTLGSKTCKTKKSTTTTTKRATTKKVATKRVTKSPVAKIVSSVSSLFSTPKKKVVSKSSPTKRKVARKTSCAKKVAAIRRILK